MRRLIAVIVVVFIALVEAGCNNSHSTGSKETLNFKESSPSSTTAAPTTTAAPVTTAARGPATTAAAPKTTLAPTTTAAKAATFTVHINPDGDAAPQFDPEDARVPVGTVVQWVNGDTTARSVVATDGKFNSGPIAPGASYSYTASTAGTINYKDGTRPYALGKLTVG